MISALLMLDDADLDSGGQRLLASSGLQAFSALIFGDFGKVEVGIEGGNQMDGYDVRG